MLQEFLKKEFSEENILFWQACEFFSHVPENDKKQVAAAVILARAFRKTKDNHQCHRFPSLIFLSSNASSASPQLSQRAREIYNSFLSSKATTPVNIDSQAQLADDILNAPRPDMFKEQQLQVAEQHTPPFPPCSPLGSDAPRLAAASCRDMPLARCPIMPFTTCSECPCALASQHGRRGVLHECACGGGRRGRETPH